MSKKSQQTLELEEETRRMESRLRALQQQRDRLLTKMDSSESAGPRWGSSAVGTAGRAPLRAGGRAIITPPTAAERLSTDRRESLPLDSAAPDATRLPPMYPDAAAAASSRAGARGLAGPVSASSSAGLPAASSRTGDPSKASDRAGAAAAAAQALFDFSGDDAPSAGAASRLALGRRPPPGAQSAAAGSTGSGGGSIRLDTSAARSPGRVTSQTGGASSTDAAAAGFALPALGSRGSDSAAAGPAAGQPVVRRRPPTAGRRDPIPSQAAGWTPAQAQHWLGTLGQGLERYAPLFAEHEVAGATLLELGPGDLDYMGIKPLAHRKALLKGVEELREAVQAASEAVGGEPRASAAAAAASGGGDGAAGSVEPQLVHWSHLQPLPEPKHAPAAQTAPSHVSMDGGADAGDLRSGGYDEAAEAEAFKAAVMAWRNAGKASSGAAAGAGSDSAAAATTASADAVADAAGGMWVNPFFGAPPQAAAAATSSSEGADGKGVAGARAAASTAAAAASLLSVGEYDEEAERRAFQQAVMDWRSGKKTASDGSAAATGAGAGTGTGTTTAPGRAPCYQCFRMCSLASAHVPAAEEAAAAGLAGKVFCSPSCFEAVRAARAGLRAKVRDAELQATQLTGSSSGQPGGASSATSGDAAGSGAAGSQTHAARVQQLQRELEAMSRDFSPTPAAAEALNAAEGASTAAASIQPPTGSSSGEPLDTPQEQGARSDAGSTCIAPAAFTQPLLPPAGAAGPTPLPSSTQEAVVAAPAARARTLVASPLVADGAQPVGSAVDLSAVLSAAEETASLAAAELLQRRKRALELDDAVPPADGAPVMASAAAPAPAAQQLPTDMQSLQGVDVEAFL